MVFLQPLGFNKIYNVAFWSWWFKNWPFS